MRELSQGELIIIFGGFAVLWVVAGYLRLRRRRGLQGLRSLELCYWYVVVVGIYFFITNLTMLGVVVVILALIGVVYERWIGARL